MDNRQPTGTWAGHPQFTCRWCAFDVLDDAKRVDDHEQAAHADQYLEDLFAADRKRRPAVPVPVQAPAPTAAPESFQPSEPAPDPAHEE